jgi:hypothetical protein
MLPAKMILQNLKLVDLNLKITVMKEAETYRQKPLETLAVLSILHLATA